MSAQSQLAKTHCPRGHLYDEANTYRSGNKRSCRTCHLKRMTLPASRLVRVAYDKTAYPMALRAAHRANQRARKFGLGDEIATRDVLELWKRQPLCLGCGHGRGLDHIRSLYLGGGNAPANLQNLCRPCNTRKFNAERWAA